MSEDKDLLQAQKKGLQEQLQLLKIKLIQNTGELKAAKAQNNRAAIQVLSSESQHIQTEMRALMETLNHINADLMSLTKTSSLAQSLYEDKQDLIRKIEQYRTKRNYFNMRLENEPLSADEAQSLIHKIKALDAEIKSMTKEFWKVSDELKTVKKDYPDTFKNLPRLDPSIKNKVLMQQRVRDEGSKTERSSRISRKSFELLVIADTLKDIDNDIGSLNDEMKVLEDTSKKLDRIKKKRKQKLPSTV